MSYTNGSHHLSKDLTEAIAAQTLLLEEVRDHLKKMPDNLKDMTGEIKGVVKEMHGLNASVRMMTDPKDGYVALIAGRRQVPLTTHVITVVGLVVCLVAAILALTNADLHYGDFYIGKKKHAIESSRD